MASKRRKRKLARAKCHPFESRNSPKCWVDAFLPRVWFPCRSLVKYGGPFGCTKCAIGRYPETSTRLCLSCHPSCAECTGPGAASCSSCSPKLVLNGGKCSSPTTADSRTECRDCRTSGEEITHSGAAGKRRIPMDSIEAAAQSFKRTRHLDYHSPIITVTVIVVIACLVVVILFTILFTVLQVRMACAESCLGTEQGVRNQKNTGSVYDDLTNVVDIVRLMIIQV
ncbi:hypothetical protein AAG570_009704 [Ranatra chinensis]|uniref:TNFR-Cys domain-containing protein n=1 Tax=Ranatra chinensis TaxID=642074 RepID=A0ABD0YPU3_9HEMI